MLSQHHGPNDLPPAGGRPGRRKRSLLGPGVGLLAVPSAAVLVASGVEQVRDRADRAT